MQLQCWTRVYPRLCHHRLILTTHEYLPFGAHIRELSVLTGFEGASVTVCVPKPHHFLLTVVRHDQLIVMTIDKVLTITALFVLLTLAHHSVDAAVHEPLAPQSGAAAVQESQSVIVCFSGLHRDDILQFCSVACVCDTRDEPVACAVASYTVQRSQSAFWPDTGLAVCAQHVMYFQTAAQALNPAGTTIQGASWTPRKLLGHNHGGCCNFGNWGNWGGWNGGKGEGTSQISAPNLKSASTSASPCYGQITTCCIT